MNSESSFIKALVEFSSRIPSHFKFLTLPDVFSKNDCQLENPSGVRLAAFCAEDLRGVERGVAVAAPSSLRGGSRFSPGVPPPEEDGDFKKDDDGKEEYHVKYGPAVGCDDR